MQAGWNRLSKAWLIRAVHFYRNYMSKNMLHSCRFFPTCSEYAEVAIKKYGASRGLQLATLRLLRCHPLIPSGVDPVP